MLALRATWKFLLVHYRLTVPYGLYARPCRVRVFRSVRVFARLCCIWIGALATVLEHTASGFVSA